MNFNVVKKIFNPPCLPNFASFPVYYSLPGYEIGESICFPNFHISRTAALLTVENTRNTLTCALCSTKYEMCDDFLTRGDY